MSTGLADGFVLPVIPLLARSIGCSERMVGVVSSARKTGKLVRMPFRHVNHALRLRHARRATWYARPFHKEVCGACAPPQKSKSQLYDTQDSPTRVAFIRCVRH